MACTIKTKYDQEEYAKAEFSKRIETAKSTVNMNENMRYEMDGSEIIEEDGLGDIEDMSAVGTEQINKQVLKQFAEKGADGLKDYVREKHTKLTGMYGLTAGSTTMQELSEDITQPAELYDALATKITEDEEFDAETLSKEEKKLYLAIRKVLKMNFALLQREVNFLFKNNTFIKPQLVISDAAERIDVAVKKWAEKFSSDNVFLNFILGGLSKGSGNLAKAVSVDNLLLKMGFQKGSIEYELGWAAMEKNRTLSEVDNINQSKLLGNLLKKHSSISKFLTRNSFNGIQKQEIDLNGRKENLSISEIITSYLTLRQPGVKERFVYDEAHLENTAKKGAKPREIVLDEFGKRKKSYLVVTQSAFESIQKTAEKYPDIIKQFEEIFAEQHKKVSDTLFARSGQSLPELPIYFPTISSTTKSVFDIQQNQIEDLSSTKERRNGLESLRIQDVFSAMNNYIHATNYYAHMTLPIHNAQVMMQRLESGGHFKGQFDNIHKTYMKWLEEMKGNKTQLSYEDIDKGINKWFSLYYRGVLGFNIPVVLKQPVAALHAVNFFGDIKYGKYVLNAYKEGFSFNRKILEEIKKYNPIIAMYIENLASPELGTLMKTGGFSHTGTVINSGMGGYVGQLAKKSGQYVLDKSLEPTRHFDLAGRIALWEASKEYVTDKHKLTEKDEDKYWNRVAALHNQVMNETQQTFDIMHRSEWGRNTNPVVRGLLMFTTQLQKHFSLFDKAMTNYVMYGRKEDASNLMRTGLSISIMQAGLIAMLDMGKDALLGFSDDDDEEFRTLAAKTFSNNISTIPFMNFISNSLTNAVWGTDEFTRPTTIPVFEGMNYFQDNFNSLADLRRDKKDLDEFMGDFYDGVWKSGFKFVGFPLSPVKQIDQAIENRKE